MISRQIELLTSLSFDNFAFIKPTFIKSMLLSIFSLFENVDSNLFIVQCRSVGNIVVTRDLCVKVSDSQIYKWFKSVFIKYFHQNESNDINSQHALNTIKVLGVALQEIFQCIANLKYSSSHHPRSFDNTPCTTRAHLIFHPVPRRDDEMQT